MELLELYYVFFKMGILTFGGGLTMLPILKHELIETRKWIDEDTLLNCYAIGQCTPGIIAVNTATYVGYIRQGIAGGVSATMGMISPSILIITIVAMFLTSVINSPIIQHALMGIRGAVCALMLNTVISLAKKSLVSKEAVAICLVAFLLALFTNISTIIIVVLAGVTGYVIDRYKGGQVNE